jgi:hypothetical protein
MWAALVLREPLPKDHLVGEAFHKLEGAHDGSELLSVLQELLELAQDGATLIDMEMLVQVVKRTRTRVGATVWTKTVAKHFGEVLQALRQQQTRK